MVVPGSSGQAHVAKDLEQRQLTLALVVTGEARPGQAPSGQALAANLDVLLALFGASGQQALTRTRGIRAETAQAECVSLNVVPRGPVHADLIVDLWLADPLWYAAAATSTSTPFSSVPTNLALTNAGSCLLYTSPSPRDRTRYRMPPSACKKKNDHITAATTTQL